MTALFHQVDLRLARARKHLTELENLAEFFCDTTSKPITFYSDDWEDLSETYIAGNKCEVLAETEIGEISVVIDDVVHNLRAVLNYLVIVLARFDSMKQNLPRSLQFPIESCENKFREHRPSYLHGVSPEHVAMIERVQPYKGCYWTELLRRLSNMGKHVELVRLVHTAASLPEDETESLAKSVIDDVIDSTANIDETIEYAGYPSSVTVYVEVSTQIAFVEGSPVVDQLHELETQISNFVEQIKASLPLVKTRPVT